jgi:hypothetical protein
MKYSVIWVPSAESRLASLWLQETNRQGLTEAANSIDQRLELSPLDCGEIRPNGVGVMFEAPLAVLFRVDEQKHLVFVLSVWRYRVGPKSA